MNEITDYKAKVAEIDRRYAIEKAKIKCRYEVQMALNLLISEVIRLHAEGILGQCTEESTAIRCEILERYSRQITEANDAPV